MPNLTAVDSLSIQGVGYDPSHGILRVAFRSGTVYDYYGADPKLVSALLHAPSKGAFFASNIRDKLNYQRVK